MSYIFSKTTVAIIIVVAVIFGLSANEISQFVKQRQAFARISYQNFVENPQDTYASQEVCQHDTGTICIFEACDFIPTGKTYEEVCGKDFKKGWKSTNDSIPDIYQDLLAIRLDIAIASQRGTLEITPRLNEITYASTYGVGEQKTASKKITTNDGTRLINKFILYDFLGLARRIDQPVATNKRYTITLLADPERISGDSQGSSTISLTCDATSCPREIIDLKNDIVRLWGGTVDEES
ncbi:MAG: hypothetical protein AAB490_00280 [Patescibacteria group bacterium]